MADYILREMQDDDLGEVISLVQEASDFPWSAGKIVDSLNSRNDLNLVLCGKDSGRILGYAVLHFVLDESQLLNIAVLKARQGEGLGAYFLQQLIAAAQSAHGRIMLLEVRASNQTAIRLYEKQGFVRSGIRKGYYPAAGKEREDAWLYSLSLS